MPTIKIEGQDNSMTSSNGRGSLRPGGRSPPFLLIGLTVALFIIGFNYWSVSSRNSELLNEITILKREVKNQAAMKFEQVKRSDEANLKVSKCLEESESTIQRCKIEKDEALSKHMVAQKKVDDCVESKKACDDDINGIKDQLQQVQSELEAAKEKQSKMECDMNACSQHIGNIVNILTNSIGKEPVRNALATNGVNVTAFFKDLVDSSGIQGNQNGLNFIPNQQKPGGQQPGLEPVQTQAGQQPGLEQGQAQAGQQPGLEQGQAQAGQGQPGLEPGQPQAGQQPGLEQGQAQAGEGQQPGLEPGQPQAGQGQQPGLEPGQPQAGQGQQPGLESGQFQAGQGQQPGLESGQPQAGQGQPGLESGQPQAGQGQPGLEPGQPQAGQGQPGLEPGQPQAGQGQQPGQPQTGQGQQPGEPQAGQGQQPGEPQAGQGQQPGQPQAGQGQQPGQPQAGQGQQQPGQGQQGKQGLETGQPQAEQGQQPGQPQAEQGQSQILHNLEQHLGQEPEKSPVLHDLQPGQKPENQDGHEQKLGLVTEQQQAGQQGQQQQQIGSPKLGQHSQGLPNNLPNPAAPNTPDSNDKGKNEQPLGSQAIPSKNNDDQVQTTVKPESEAEEQNKGMKYQLNKPGTEAKENLDLKDHELMANDNLILEKLEKSKNRLIGENKDSIGLKFKPALLNEEKDYNYDMKNEDAAGSEENQQGAGPPVEIEDDSIDNLKKQLEEQ